MRGAVHPLGLVPEKQRRDKGWKIREKERNKLSGDDTKR